jgi:hypothetical protein
MTVREKRSIRVGEIQPGDSVRFDSVPDATYFVLRTEQYGSKGLRWLTCVADYCGFSGSLRIDECLPPDEPATVGYTNRRAKRLRCKARRHARLEMRKLVKYCTPDELAEMNRHD